MRIDSKIIYAISEALTDKDIVAIAKKFDFNKYTVKRILNCHWYNDKVVREALIIARKNVQKDYLLSDRARVLADILNVKIKD